MVVEDDSVMGKPVEFRSLHDSIAHAAEGVGTMIVSQYKDNVWRALSLRRYTLRKKRRRSSCLNEISAGDFHMFQLPGKLHCNLNEARRQSAGNAPEIYPRASVCIWIRKLRVIEGVEKLTPQFEASCLTEPKRKLLVNADIPVVLTRAADRSPS
jgi:hypothetical protein